MIVFQGLVPDPGQMQPVEKKRSNPTDSNLLFLPWYFMSRPVEKSQYIWNITLANQYWRILEWVYIWLFIRDLDPCFYPVKTISKLVNIQLSQWSRSKAKSVKALWIRLQLCSDGKLIGFYIGFDRKVDKGVKNLLSNFDGKLINYISRKILVLIFL